MTDIAKRMISKVSHSSLVREVMKYKEIKDLDKLPNVIYPVNNLRYLSGADFYQIFDDPETEEDWYNNASLIKSLELPEMMGGVNKGDQRAIFYLINHFQPCNVLEIGTHIGCSTVHIALALRRNPVSHLTTVDVIDVNDTVNKNWTRFNSKHSPSELMEMIGARDKVNFVNDDSTNFLRNCKQKFDFVFLDGSHKAKMVFQEIPLAMNLLNKSGIIMLHDYFPDNKPLWKDLSTIPGPYLAVHRIISKENNIAVLPLGELPWETKRNSNYTSLALLTRKDPQSGIAGI